MSNCHIFGK